MAETKRSQEGLGIIFKVLFFLLSPARSFRHYQWRAHRMEEAPDTKHNGGYFALHKSDIVKCIIVSNRQALSSKAVWCPQKLSPEMLNLRINVRATSRCSPLGLTSYIIFPLSKSLAQSFCQMVRWYGLWKYRQYHLMSPWNSIEFTSYLFGLFLFQSS